MLSPEAMAEYFKEKKDEKEHILGLDKENEKLKKKNKALRKRISDLEDKIDTLKHEIMKIERKALESE